MISLAEGEVGFGLPVERASLEAALQSPSASADGVDRYPGLHLKAAVLLAELLRRRPLGRGNIRVALLAAIVFLNLNGLEVQAEDADLVALATMASEDRLSLLTIAAAFEAVTRRMPLLDEDEESDDETT